MKVYYIDSDGLFLGEGESYTLPSNAVRTPPQGNQKWNGEAWEDTPKTFDTEKQAKLNKVSEKFLQMFKSGTFVSESLGFEVDNRRYGDKFDKDNVESLIEQLSDMAPDTTIQFKGVDGFHELNLSQLETLKKEMIADGLAKHQWKWAKENEINSIVVDENTTAEQAIQLLEGIEV